MFLVTFQGGGGGPDPLFPPPHLDPHMIEDMPGSRKFSQGVKSDNVFFLKSSLYFTEGHTDLPLEADPEGPIASKGGSVPVFLRIPMTTCNFPGRS